jgi:hypothetical protein
LSSIISWENDTVGVCQNTAPNEHWGTPLRNPRRKCIHSKAITLSHSLGWNLSNQAAEQQPNQDWQCRRTSSWQHTVID